MDSMTLAAEKQKYFDKVWDDICARNLEVYKPKKKNMTVRIKRVVIAEKTINGLKFIVRRKVRI